jgi:hypothetical protein
VAGGPRATSSASGGTETVPGTVPSSSSISSPNPPGTPATSGGREIRQATVALEEIREQLKSTGVRLAAAEGEGGEDDETAVPTSAVIFCVLLDHLDPAIADLRAAAGDSPTAGA